MRYLLDTNILIAAMKGHEAVRKRLESTPVSELVLSPVVLGELELGVAKSQHKAKNAARLAHVAANLPLVVLDADVSRHYGAIRAELEMRGTPIGANDCWIAAQARALGATIVTDNVGEFMRVPELAVENWLS
jgi:tRNA(fMet)-specific endonuclease VapC